MAEQDLAHLMESVEGRASKDPNDRTNKKENKEEKKDKKDEKEKKDDLDDDEKLGIGGKLIMAVVALIIVVIWLAIFALLVKMDVGGFGSSILYPVLKDVPYVNMILPGIEEYVPAEDEGYGYKTVDEAIERIKELETEVEALKATNEESAAYISELEAGAAELAEYKSNQASFETEKEKFYEEVVFSDKAPDINTYKSYYESIEPENAEAIYKQVVTQLKEDKELEDYVATYSSMKAKNAAAIFDSMTDDYDLVCQILTAMDSSQRADILAAMDKSNAAIVTRMMEP